MRRRVAVSPYPELLPAEEIELPDTLEEYTDLWRVLESERLAGHLETWKALMRIWSLGDGYFRLRFVMSAGRDAWNKYRNEPHFWHPAHLDLARRIQFEGTDNAVLIGARTFGKSTHFINDDIGNKLRDPNHASMWFSLTRELAAKKLRSLQREMETNKLLSAIWPDRFWASADERPPSVSWSIRDGLSIKRTTTRPEQSCEAHAFEKALPTGSHPDKRYYDDIEADVAAESPEVQRTIEERWVSSQNLHSTENHRATTGTYYGAQGMMLKLSTVYGLKTWLYPGENLDRLPESEEEAGPFKGAPDNGFTKEELWQCLADAGGAHREEDEEGNLGPWKRRSNRVADRDYSLQIACNPTAGETAKLKWRDIRRYTHEDFLRVRRRSTAVLCVDPSNGVNDPSLIWVWLLTPERNFFWVDAEMRVIPPSERRELIFQLSTKWSSIAARFQRRIEQFGPSEGYSSQLEYEKQFGVSFQTLKCSDVRKSKTERILARWEPNTSAGTVFFPVEMVRRDEHGNQVDLVDYFKRFEWDPFPRCRTDNMLDAGGLLWEDPERVGSLPWPPRLAKRRQASDDSVSYASAGIL